MDDLNEMVVRFEWDENEDHRAFFESEEIHEKLAEAGLTDHPDITMLELVDQKPAQQPSA